MRSRTIFAGLALALLLTGCAGIGPATEGGCTAFRPIYTSKADVLTDGTAEQVLAHNLAGARICGWRPAREKG
ncbi:hypothetical protein FZ029_28135 [Azospirillum sp. Sh1]|nr:hypothetical protein FZ029_28135 [Azospirillum sp. Sh1]